MHADRARLAWGILIGAFVLFLGSCQVVRSQGIGLIEGASRPEPAQILVERGWVTLARAGTADALGARPEQPAHAAVRPGTVITTDDNTEAVVRFFDGTTVELRPNSRLTVETSRQRLFATGHDDIRATLDQGRARIRVAPAERRTFTLATPGGALELAAGDYVVPVTGETAWVRVFAGGGVAREAGLSAAFGRDERLQLARGRPPLTGLPAEFDLLRQGEFDAPGATLDGWEIGNRDVEQGLPGGEVTLDHDGGEPVLRFRRRVGANYHAETYLLQPLTAYVRDFDDIRVRVRFRVLHQTLSGGGYLGTEYPLELRLKWFNRSGQEVIYRRGFYVKPPRDGTIVRVDSQAVAAGWVEFEESLTDSAFPLSRPDYLVDAQLVASGWDYESVVGEFRILVR